MFRPTDQSSYKMCAAKCQSGASTTRIFTTKFAKGNTGYASGYDNRTSLILFRHSGVNVLVQCGILYDVTRTVINCYELR